MNLHENRKMFTDAVLAASEHLHIKTVYIEKDYWITRSLKLMAQNPNAERAIFKGGSFVTMHNFFLLSNALIICVDTFSRGITQNKPFHFAILVSTKPGRISVTVIAVFLFLACNDLV